MKQNPHLHHLFPCFLGVVMRQCLTSGVCICSHITGFMWQPWHLREGWFEVVGHFTMKLLCLLWHSECNYQKTMCDRGLEWVEQTALKFMAIWNLRMCLYLEIDVIKGKSKVRSCRAWAVNPLRMTFWETKTHKDRTKRAGDKEGRNGHAAAMKPKTPWTRESCGVRL